MHSLPGKTVKRLPSISVVMITALTASKILISLTQLNVSLEKLAAHNLNSVITTESIILSLISLYTPLQLSLKWILQKSITHLIS